MSMVHINAAKSTSGLLRMGYMRTITIKVVCEEDTHRKTDRSGQGLFDPLFNSAQALNRLVGKDKTDIGIAPCAPPIDHRGGRNFAPLK